MAPPNGSATSVACPSDSDALPSVWNRFIKFLIRRRVRITGILLTVLILEDLIVGVVPRSIFDFQNVYSMAGVTLVLLGVALRSWAAGTLHKNSQLTMTGPYGLVRHPLYVGSFMVMIGFCILINDRENIWFVTGPMLALFFILARNEERNLAKIFPAQWDNFAKKVPRFIPRRLPSISFDSWNREQWLANREYRMLSAVMLGLLAVQTWHVFR